MRRYVYEPLEMTTVGYGAAGTARRVDQPWPHKMDGKIQKPVRPGPLADNAELIGPAARVHCSMADWAKFASEILQTAGGTSDASPTLLGSTAGKQLLTPVFEGYGYAGGWIVNHNRVYGNTLGHTGSNTLNFAQATLIPDKGFGVLIATNTAAPNARNACSIAKTRIAADWLFGGMDPVALSHESYRANQVFQWVARIQNDLIERGRRYMTTELHDVLVSPAGQKLCEQIRAEGNPVQFQFLGLDSEDGEEFSIYRVTFPKSVWRFEYGADRKYVTSRLKMQPLTP